jgi:hypothetical protein
MQAARFRHALEKVMLGVLCTASAGAVGTVLYLKKVEGHRLKIDITTPENNAEDFLGWLPHLSKGPPEARKPPSQPPSPQSP